MHALSALSNLAAFIQESLGEWVEVIYSASDSTIAISWSIYEKAKLMVFQRLRVANIRQKLNLENLFHIDGKHNLADFGTRPDLVTADLLRPESEWIKGKKWMTMSIEDAQKTGILKNTKDIILDNELKKELRKGANFDDFEQADHVVSHIDVKRVAEVENGSNYLYSPLKRTFRSVVRIHAYVILACRKFKRKIFLAKAKRGEKLSDGTTPEQLNFPPPKFVSFPIIVTTSHEENLNNSKQYQSHGFIPSPGCDCNQTHVI